MTWASALDAARIWRLFAGLAQASSESIMPSSWSGHRLQMSSR